MKRPAVAAAEDELCIEIDARLPSGKSIAKVNVHTAMSGNELKAELEKYVEEGNCIQQLVFNSVPLSSSTLADAGVGIGDPPHLVNVIIGFFPTLHMFEPCSTADLAQSLVNLNGFGAVSDIPVFSKPLRFTKMEQAPAEAREIAKSLRTALEPELGNMFESPLGGFFQGHVIVISGVIPQDDYPQKGKGKGKEKGKEIARRHFSGKDNPLKKTCCEALGGINNAAFDDFPGEGDSLWRMMYVKPVEISNADEYPFGMYDAENISDAAKACARSGQQVMRS